MILQSELATVLAARTRAAKQFRTREARAYAEAQALICVELKEHEQAYKQSAAYTRYVEGSIAIQHRLSNLTKPAAVLAAEAAEEEAAQALESLKKHYRKDREVEAGPLRLVVEGTPSVSWEAVLTKLREVPAVAKALLVPAAQKLLALANAKDPSAPFVTERIARFDVE